VIARDKIHYTVTFLPWLRLHSSVETNGVVFWNFPKESKKFDPTNQFKNQLRLIFRGYKDPTGKPLDTLTVVSLQNEPFKDLTSDDATFMTELVRLFAFSAMAENQYYRQGGAYLNSTHFQHMHQRFQLNSKYVAPHARRRNGSIWHSGYKHGELKFSIPIQAWGFTDAKLNTKLLHALAKLLSQKTSAAAAIRQTINWFFLGNSDSESVSEETEVILMGNAFETLFQVQKSQEKKFALMERLSKLFVGCLSKKTKKAGLDGTTEMRSWKVLWMDEFYWLRNKIVHGGDIDYARMTWSHKEHLTIAAMTLQISIKLILSEEGSYSLSSDDKTCADCIDHFIAKGKLSESKLLNVRQKILFDRDAQSAWATLHSKK